MGKQVNMHILPGEMWSDADNKGDEDAVVLMMEMAHVTRC